jgi:hypothetical protein
MQSKTYCETLFRHGNIKNWGESVKKQEVINYLEDEICDMKMWYRIQKNLSEINAEHIKKQIDIYRYLLRSLIKKGEKK